MRYPQHLQRPYRYNQKSGFPLTKTNFDREGQGSVNKWSAVIRHSYYSRTKIIKKAIQSNKWLANYNISTKKALTDYQNVLQILHVKNPEKKTQAIDHWSVLSTNEL